MDNPANLEEKIKQTFKLFQGLRSQEEDQKIYDQIMEKLFEEISKFMAENLSESDFSAMSAELAKAASEEEKSKVMDTYIAKIDNYKLRLSARLDGFANNLLIEHMEKGQI